MEITTLNLSDIKPYKNNAKLHPDWQIEQIIKSIQEFGNNDPIAIWGDENIIVEGHGRYLALKKMGAQEIPCIRLDHLTEEEQKAYTLVHNKTTMNTDFDLDLLDGELEGILDIDMKDFGFDLSDFSADEDEKQEGGYFGDERERTYDAYNLSEYDSERTAGFYQMPIIRRTDYIPDGIISFNYMLSAKDRTKGIHFYCDDYQFERVWNHPQVYIEKLKDFPCVFTPDFSLYMDMPMSMKIWNVYRSRLIGQMCQNSGMEVIPTLSWAEADTFTFCFDGIEPGGTVSVSTIGVKRNGEATKIWTAGMDEAMRRLKPKTVLVYGGDIGYDFGKAKAVYYDNETTERMKNSGR